MVPHMKTTIEIADGLLVRARERAKQQRITLRALIESSLAETLDREIEPARIEPVTFKGNGLTKEFDGASWERVRDAIYE